MKNAPNRRVRSYAFLFITALLWGFAFAAQRLGGKALGPFSFNGIRFVIGCVSLIPLVIWMGRARARQGAYDSPDATSGKTAALRRTERKNLVGAGAVCGTVLFCGSSLQQVGMLWTEAGKAAFLTGLYIVLVPIAGLLAGRRQGWGLGLGAGLAAIGLYLMSVRNGFSVSLGDSLEIASAFFWAGHILVLAYFSRRHDAVALALVQNATCAALSLAVAIFAEGFGPGTVACAFAPGPAGSLIPILYTGIGSIGIAYTLQILGQKGVAAGPAALIMSMETVFAAIGGALVLGETMDARALAGAALMLAGMLAAQLIPPDFGTRRDNAPS
ncbi:MAG TPA: DMT family transporter [Treponemataceae bacterium]|nr:DMT family transporter [Treponemataceae bacterium]HPS44925.1 DMT family transporter [Treponemataceae bacterium]